ncbi:MAG TPA: SUMF1/EgtB/PvdO family nonheme iron enzyme [Acidobacteriota bacterium]|nr:SUMF1/EgtB/PvdO family nonheme iron enzyme [Acidobacteriota bacterium]
MIELITIPGSTFHMGSQTGADDERPIYEVFLKPYHIGKFPITNREFNQFRTDHPELKLIPLESNFNDPDQPVTSVSWFDAVAFCEWLRNKTGKLFRLPTEAEWEFAATAGNQQNIYPWGTRSWNERPELHNIFKNGPVLVGSFEPNAFGIHDMCINIHEWCSDWYAQDYYSKSPAENPKGPTHGTRRSSRGGSWRHQIKITRCAARSSIPPEMRYADYGFRVAI